MSTLFTKTKLVVSLILVILMLPLFVLAGMKEYGSAVAAVENFWGAVDKVVEAYLNVSI